MRKLDAFSLRWHCCWMLVIGLCCRNGRTAASLCEKANAGASQFATLCDLEFCTCRDPFGRVKCLCPSQDPNEEIVIRANGLCSVSPNVASLTLGNCPRVVITKEAFRDVGSLQSLELVNVSELSLEGQIFPSSGPTRTITIKNSTIPDVPSFAFTGNLESVTFDGCRLGTVRAFAFSNIHAADRIVFKETIVDNVEAQSFKKFSVNKLLFVGSRFDVIPSRFVADVSVEILFKIESTHVNAIRTSGFKINNPKKVLVIRSTINRLHEEAFKITARGDVVIEDNVFNVLDNEAFRGICLDKYSLVQNGKQMLKFNNQTISNLRYKSLYFNRTSFDVHLEKVKVDEGCSCDALAAWKDALTYSGYSSGGGITQEFSALQILWCRTDEGTSYGESVFVEGKRFYEDYCTKLTSGIYFFVIIIASTAAGVLFVAAAVACALKRRRNKWKYVPSAAADSQREKSPRTAKEKKRGKNKEMVRGKSEATKAIIVPDGRTYKETEFHIIVEKAEPLHEECIAQTVVRDRSRSQMNLPNREDG